MSLFGSEKNITLNRFKVKLHREIFINALMQFNCIVLFWLYTFNPYYFSPSNDFSLKTLPLTYKQNNLGLNGDVSPLIS